MIQVIERTFDILTTLTQDNPMRLKDIAETVGLNKKTVANILVSLKQLGYLEQEPDRSYRLSDRFYLLSQPKRNADALQRIAEENAESLSGQIRESVIVLSVEKNEGYIIAEAKYDQPVTVNEKVYHAMGLYALATGRIILAYLGKEALGAYTKEKGLPTAEQWPEARTSKTLQAALHTLRNQGVARILKPEIAGMAVPLFKGDGAVWGALGVYLPRSRFSDDHQQEIDEGLRKAAQRINHQVARQTVLA